MPENPAFEKAFAVYASDEVEARYALTPVMMDRILALRGRIVDELDLNTRIRTKGVDDSWLQPRP